MYLDIKSLSKTLIRSGLFIQTIRLTMNKCFTKLCKRMPSNHTCFPDSRRRDHNSETLINIQNIYRDTTTTVTTTYILPFYFICHKHLPQMSVCLLIKYFKVVSVKFDETCLVWFFLTFVTCCIFEHFHYFSQESTNALLKNLADYSRIICQSLYFDADQSKHL